MTIKRQIKDQINFWQNEKPGHPLDWLRFETVLRQTLRQRASGVTADEIVKTIADVLASFTHRG